jgi:uncharacterized protein YcbK (DUF882 family)
MRGHKFFANAGGYRPPEIPVSRRQVLMLGAMAAIGGILPRAAFSDSIRPQAAERALGFYNTHTDERLKAVYWEKGHYIPESLTEINRILRDHRTGEVENIDKDLLDLLFALQNKVEIRDPFHVISGYRSASTNAALRLVGTGVAKNSLHMVGKAIDIRAPGLDLSALRRAAVALKGGGVGYYPRSDFVHVDVGRVRYW